MRIKRVLCLLLSIIMIIGTTSAAFADNSDDIISGGIGSAESYINNQLTEYHNNGGVSYGFEWFIISMLRAGKQINADILDEYYASVANTVKGWTYDIKPTDAEKAALALSVMGKDITDIEGVNLADLIINNERLKDGSNELAYALIALDAAKAEIPEGSKWNRESIVSELLKFQADNGGFGLNNNTDSDIDMTAICLQALIPYSSNPDISNAVNKAISYLKTAISENFNYNDNANSTAQVLLALSALKIDVTNPENGFGNEQKNIITALMEYKNPEGNGFMFGDKVNSMATVQVMQALDAYRKALKEDLLYWDFSKIGQVYDDTESGDNTPPEKSEADPAKVYVTIADDGKIVTDKNGNYVALAEVTVNDLDKNGTLSYDEALYATHETYFEGGAEAGYSTFTGDYGLSLAILWGKGTENVAAASGYYLNNASCWSLNDTVKEGDHLTAFNYKDTAFWSDSYSYFADNEISVKQGESVTVALSKLGYDAQWNTVSLPCDNASIKIIGTEGTPIITDENGKAEINTDGLDTGTYYILAFTETGSIVPSVCKLTVTKKPVSTGGSGNSGGSVSENISVYIKVSDPKGETFLKKTSYSIKKGSSVYDLLKMTDLNIEIANTAYGIYIKSIEGLSEFDEGNESGWMYRVNGKFSDYSIDLHTLSKGDYVELLYTRNLGKDLGKAENVPSSSDNSKPKEENISNPEITPLPEQDKAFDSSTYNDISPDSWYYESVKYVYENNLMFGTENGFEPESKMTRAMLVTVLYRMANPENNNYSNNFKDVPNDEWYTKAVSWAAENNIVSGISETEFAPNMDVTREQLAVIIYRYAKMQGYSVSESYNISKFDDANEISSWAVESIKWAIETALISGTSEITLSPKDTATRAQVAAILMRFSENIQNKN